MQPKHDSGYRIGIVNPLTLVGNEIKAILRERSFPYVKLVLLDSTGEAAGALTEIDDEPAVVGPASDVELDDLDVVFFCGPPARNRQWIEQSRNDKFIAIDLSQPTTLDDGTLAVAGMNLQDLAGKRLIVSPHPIAIPIALVLHQIEAISPVELCITTVVQPASEFDQQGIEELAQQAIGVLNVKPVPKSLFDRQLAFNLYPAPAHNESFIVSLLKKLVDPEAQLALMITQGTIFHGHTFSMFVRTQDAIETERIVAALGQSRAIAFPEGDQAFGTVDAAGRDEVLIAEVRPDPAVPGGFWVWAVCDNLRRSSALNAVLTAEELLFGAGAAN